MIKIFAIAGLTARLILRSRLFLVLAAAITILTLALSSNIKSDGTASGWAKVFLTYQIGLSYLLISAAALFISASSALEIDSRRIHMIVVKPVPKCTVWLGKWLGICSINAMLIVITGVLAATVLRSATMQAKYPPEQIEALKSDVLTGRILVAARPDYTQNEVSQMVSNLYSSGSACPDTDRTKVEAYCINIIKAAKSTIGSGKSKDWQIDIPAVKLTESDNPCIRYAFKSIGRDAKPVECRWTITRAGSTEPYSLTVTNNCNEPMQIPISGSILKGTGTLSASLMNISDHQIFMDPGYSVAVAFRAAGFNMNLISCILILLISTALISAIGLTCGSLFSFPVASFCSFAVLAIALLSQSFDFLSNSHWIGGCSHEEHSEKSAITSACEKIAKGISALTLPALESDPVSMISDGLLISPKQIVKAFIIKICCYSALFALLGIYVLKRRELGLPSKQ